MKRCFENMKKNIVVIIGAIVFILILMIPILFNDLLLSWRANGVFGDSETWILFFATYYGAVLGKGISGSLTLIGVRLTVKSAITAKEYELTIQTTKDRLFNFYHPIDNLFNSFTFKHGAHDFVDLSFEDQLSFLNLINENIVYADSKLNLLIIEIKWSFKEKDYKKLNSRYNELREIVMEHMIELREQLKLPKIY